MIGIALRRALRARPITNTRDRLAVTAFAEAAAYAASEGRVVVPAEALRGAL